MITRMPNYLWMTFFRDSEQNLLALMRGAAHGVALFANSSVQSETLTTAAEANCPRRCERDNPPQLPRRRRNGYFGSLPFSASSRSAKGPLFPSSAIIFSAALIS